MPRRTVHNLYTVNRYYLYYYSCRYPKFTAMTFDTRSPHERAIIEYKTYVMN